MFRSPRFSDIFGSKPIQLREGDRPGPYASNRDGMDPEAVWLDITAAHRQAVLTLTPRSLKKEDLWSE